MWWAERFILFFRPQKEKEKSFNSFVQVQKKTLFSYLTIYYIIIRSY